MAAEQPADGAVGSKGTTVERKVATIVGVAKKLSQDAARFEAALKFLKFWFSPTLHPDWIKTTWSPMGLQYGKAEVEALDPLPKQFLGIPDQAKSPYTLPPTKAMQDRQWDDSGSAIQALQSGKSADDALKQLVTEMSKYMKS